MALPAAVWWLYLLAYGAFPLSLASDLYHLFLGIVARNPQYWLYLLVPIACQLPDFFWRQIRRLVAPDNHHILQELMLLERRQGGVARTVSSVREPVAGKEDLMDTKAIGLRVFGNKQNINTGYVPPYHRDSRYYNFRITNPWKGSHPSAAAMAAPVTTSPKQDKGAERRLRQCKAVISREASTYWAMSLVPIVLPSSHQPAYQATRLVAITLALPHPHPTQTLALHTQPDSTTQR
ncbi:hypothetical protein V8C86DRAFT_1508442 [Haematococcus lacustris]